MPESFDFKGASRARALILGALATLSLSAAAVAALGTGAPPRPKGAPGAAVTASEAKALADWTLAQPQVATRVKSHRTRLLKVALSEGGKDGKSGSAVLAFRDYDAGVVQQFVVDLTTGAVEVGEVARLVQPSAEEIAEGMAIVRRDPALASLAADSSLTLMGGFHVMSPYADDPCSREVCLEFAFMRPGPNWGNSSREQKVPPRRVIANLSRGVVANRDYRADAQSAAPARMTARAGQQW